MTVDEAGRLAALRRYDLPDLPAEPELDAIMRLAATVAGVETTTLNLLDDVHQCQYVTAGFDGGISPRSDAMCEVTFREGRSQHVPDARLDPRFADNPWVDGRQAQVRFYAATPIVTPDGHTLGTLCVFDSEPRELDLAQRQALDDLAGQVMALLERRRLTRAAEEASRAKSAFLATVSHEIRTPMNGVLGMLDLLLATPLDPGQHRHAELAHRSAQTLLELLDDVLDLSKGEAGEVVLAERVFDPAELCRDVVDVLSPLALARGTTLELALEAGPGLLLGDPARLRQVLVNLVGNAVKFTTVGGTVLRLTGTLRVEVTDTGPGMSAQELEQLFRPYSQGAAGREHGGTGLGLTISRELVETMGGRLTVDSEPGAGTTFVVVVPLPPAVTPDDLVGLRVLVVDDGEVNRLVATGLLEALGATAVAVDSGEAAIEAVTTSAYDVVLLDHEMPGLSGPQTARALDGAGPRLVGLTGRTSAQDVAECLAAGMDAVLAKPLRPEELLRLLGRRDA